MKILLLLLIHSYCFSLAELPELRVSQEAVSFLIPAQAGVIDFFDSISKGDEQQAKAALMKIIGLPYLSIHQLRTLFAFFVEQMNLRYHTHLTPAQAVKLAIINLGPDSEMCRHFPLLKTILIYQENSHSIPMEVEDAPEVSVDAIVGAVECFAGILCYFVPIPLAKKSAGLLIGHGFYKLIDSLREQNAMNEKWLQEHGFPK